MKKLTLMAYAVALVVSPCTYADINEDLENICTIVKNNDKSELRKKMRAVQTDYNMRLSDYYTGISCGGSSLIRYAMQNGAIDVGTYMIKKMSKKALSEVEADGLAIKQWAEENGFIDTDIGKELISRLN